ncbi:MAG TPA: hypothetical protein VE175_14170 [Woeseiaceae bacterium]|jgi:flagellar basal body-associated protein FliL|nr:hypothetical protein [Woeseiaceae bacterium]
MNLLAIIIVFLAIAICVAIAYIAWEISSDEPRAGDADAASSSDEGPCER